MIDFGWLFGLGKWESRDKEICVNNNKFKLYNSFQKLIKRWATFFKSRKTTTF